MDNSLGCETATMSMEEMEREIRSLKAKLAERNERGQVDSESVRSMLDDFLTKITDVIKPSEIRGSVKDVVDKVSDNISAHPITSISIALASGFFIGRALDRSSSRWRGGNCAKG
ncbi:MAG: hypothetical protein LBI74_09355 [Synergistaceae bacterium]|nr:hypothetical protein [Synergistaceae bacterium]